MRSSTSILSLARDAPRGRPPIFAVEKPADVAEWADRHRDVLHAMLVKWGCVLVRGLGLADSADVGSVFARLGGRLMADRESFAERGRRAEGVYCADKWPSKWPMCMHHERSYAWEFPSTMLLACLRAPTQGGATALADSAAVLDALPARLVDRFAEQGWMLSRNYNLEIGASIEDSFGADRRGYVEAYCRANAIEYAWRSGGRLRTRQRRCAVVAHPLSGDRCWFNEVAFLNEWSLDPELREFLVDTYGRDGLPFNTSYGNGEPIHAEVIGLINAVYDTRAVREPWQAGDLMLIDNIRTAHSRDPFQGPREVLVAMAHPRTAAHPSKNIVP